MRTIISLCIAALLFCQTPHCFAKPVYSAYLVNKDRQISIEDGWVGFTTKTDTIKFTGDGALSYAIAVITKDSITIKRPALYKTDTVLKNGYRMAFMFGNTRIGQSYKANGKKYIPLLSVEEFEYRSYALKDITTFQYPAKADMRDVGCMGCAIAMIIPVMNVYIYRELRQRYFPSNYKMSNGWHFEVTEINQ